MPIRMCAVCRERFEKSELLRVVKTENGIVLDNLKKAQSRGLYICSGCVDKAQKKRVFEREYKCKVEPEIYERFVLEVMNTHE